VLSWGGGDYGQLGNGSNFDSPLPFLVPAIKDVTTIEGGYRHSLLIKGLEGEVWVFGREASGGVHLTPHRLQGFERSICEKVSGGFYHSLLVSRPEPRIAREEPDLRKMFESIRQNGKQMKKVMKRHLKKKGIKFTKVLDNPNVVLHYQPGMDLEEAKSSPYEDGLKDPFLEI